MFSASRPVFSDPAIPTVNGVLQGNALIERRVAREMRISNEERRCE
jgi:hypothetical protein